MRLPERSRRRTDKNEPTGIIASPNPEPTPLPIMKSKEPEKGKRTRTRTRARTGRNNIKHSVSPGDKAVESMKKNRSVQHDSDYLQLQIGDHLSKNKRRGRSRSK